MSNELKELKKPMLREISFEGNHASSYEMRLKKQLAMSSKKKAFK